MKIKYLIDTNLSPELQALSFVDRYAGIVKTISVLQPNGTDTSVQKRYPVACDVSAVDCNNTGIYQNLVPDDSKNSVVYWEEVTPMQNSGYTKANDFYTKKQIGVARLVVWLNLNKLGIDNCKDAILTLPSIEKILTKKYKINDGGLYDGQLLIVQPKGIVKKSPKNIFGKYTYPENSQYYLYPFDYYAIDVQFELHQCLSKGGDFVLLPSVDCLNSGGTIDECQQLLDRLTEDQKNDCILPSYDFNSTTVQDSTTAQQQTDLTNWLCTAPIETPKSFILNGVDGQILFPIDTAYQFEYNTPFTLSCWVKFDTIKTSNLFNKYTTIGQDRGYFVVLLSDGSLRVDLQNDGGNFALSVLTPINVINVSQWYLITVTYGGIPDVSSINVYINGVNHNLTPRLNNLGNRTIQTNLVPLRIGSNVSMVNGIDGNISDSLVWSSELNQAQVTSEYVRKLSGTPADFSNSVAWIPGATGSQFGVDTWTQEDKSGTITGVKTVAVLDNDTSIDVPT